LRTKFLNPEDRRHCENCKFLRYRNNYTKDKVYCKLGELARDYPYPSDVFELVGRKAEDCYLFM
jgi:hypothetical protein